MKSILLILISTILIGCSSNTFYKRDDGKIIYEPIYFGFIMTNQNNIDNWAELKYKRNNISSNNQSFNNNNRNAVLMKNSGVDLQDAILSKEMQTFSINYFTKFFISTEKDGNSIYVDIVRPSTKTSNEILIYNNNFELDIEIDRIEIISKYNNFKITLNKVNRNLFEGIKYQGFNFEDVNIYIFTENREYRVSRDYWNSWSLSVGKELNESGVDKYTYENENYVSVHYNKVLNQENYTYYNSRSLGTKEIEYTNGQGLSLINYSYIDKNNFGFNSYFHFNNISSDDIKYDGVIDEFNNSIHYFGLLLGPTYTINFGKHVKTDLKTLIGISGIQQISNLQYNDNQATFKNGSYVTLDLGMNLRINLSKKINLIFNLDYIYIPEYESDNNGFTENEYFHSIRTLNYGLGIGYRF